MKFTDTIAVLASLSATTLAAPLERRHEAENPFTLNIRYSNSPLQGPIQANAGAFWVNKPTSSYPCPEGVKNCPSGTSTSFFSSGDGQLHLNVQVGGGQQVYIGPNGLLTYDEPHVTAKRNGSSVTGFEIGNEDFMSQFYQFYLCNDDVTDENAYRIWVEYRDEKGQTGHGGFNGKNTCVKVSLQVQDTSKGFGAWAYK
jgi:hypothetical protein